MTWRNFDPSYTASDGQWAHMLNRHEDGDGSDDDRGTYNTGPMASSSDAFSSMRSNTSSTVSRSVYLKQQGLESTTQGQDCCIEASSIVGPYSYYFGMIDILQEWSWEKKMERFFKSWVLQKDQEGLSAVEPVLYQDRFMSRIGDIMNLTDEGSIGDLEGGMSLEPAAIVQSKLEEKGEAPLLGGIRRGSAGKPPAENRGRAGTRVSFQDPSAGGGTDSQRSSANIRMTRDEFRERMSEHGKQRPSVDERESSTADSLRAAGGVLHRAGAPASFDAGGAGLDGASTHSRPSLQLQSQIDNRPDMSAAGMAIGETDV